MFAQSISTKVKVDEVKKVLKNIITLHQLHMDDPSTATTKSQKKMMDMIVLAYKTLESL